MTSFRRSGVDARDERGMTDCRILATIRQFALAAGCGFGFGLPFGAGLDCASAVTGSKPT
jgi:hypothetical protein